MLLAPSAASTSKSESVEVNGLVLDRNGSGGYSYKDKDADFTAEIASDGTVRFRDARLGPQKGKVSVLGFDLVRKGKRQKEPSKPFRPDLVPNGPYGAPPILGTIGGTMGGVADAMQTSRKYQAKQRFLDLTAPMRAEMARKARDKATRSALFELTHELVTTWNDPKLPLSLRKDRIFAVWDDCTEPEEGEKADEHPGARARRQIEKFVRIHARRGSDEAFSDAELRDMNERRTSRERFDPYGKK